MMHHRRHDPIPWVILKNVARKNSKHQLNHCWVDGGTPLQLSLGNWWSGTARLGGTSWSLWVIVSWSIFHMNNKYMMCLYIHIWTSHHDSTIYPYSCLVFFWVDAFVETCICVDFVVPVVPKLPPSRESGKVHLEGNQSLCAARLAGGLNWCSLT